MGSAKAILVCVIIAVAITAYTESLLWSVLAPAESASGLLKPSQLFIFSMEHFVATILIVLAALLGRWSGARKVLFSLGASLIMPGLLLLIPLSLMLGGTYLGLGLVSVVQMFLYVLASVVLIVLLTFTIITAFARKK